MSGSASLGFAAALDPSTFIEKQSDHSSIELGFVGDLMAHAPNYSHQPFDRMYDGVRAIIYGDDLSFVNLETPVDPERQYGEFPQFNVQPPYVEAAVRAGLDVFALANNHSADWYKQSVLRTQAEMEALQARLQTEKETQIWFNGLRTGGKEAEPWVLTTIEKKGLRIGFVSVAEVLNLPAYSTWVQMLEYRSEQVMGSFEVWLKEQRSKVDLLIVSIHWGYEYQLRQHDAGRKAAERLVAAGADIVWGHHPHVLQPWFWQPSPRGNGLVMASMGNFVSGQSWFLSPRDHLKERAWTGDSAIMRLRIGVKDGKVVIDHVRPILISHFKRQDGGVMIAPTAFLAKSGPKRLQEFFERRYAIMSEFYPESGGASLLYSQITGPDLAFLRVEDW